MMAFPLLLSSTCLLIGTGAGGMFSESDLVFEVEVVSAKMDMADRRVVTGRCLTVLASFIEIREVTIGIR